MQCTEHASSGCLPQIARRLLCVQEHEVTTGQPIETAELEIVQLMKQLKAFSLPATGRKAELVHCLNTFLAASTDALLW